MKKLTYWYITISILLLGMCGCAGTQKANVSQPEPFAVDYTQDEAGIMEFEFYESGAIKSVKSDSKKEPFKLFDIVKPDVEVKQ